MKKIILSLLSALLMAGIASTSSASLLDNGDFDAKVTGLTGSWGVFQLIDGWTTEEGKAGIEVQKNTVVTAQSGNQYIELDSHYATDTNARMEQDIFLTAGSYFLNFYYRPRTNKNGDNGINFGISDSSSQKDILAWNVDDINSVWTDWQLVSEHFAITTNGNYSLYFSAFGTANTLGGFIDSVSLIPNPEPATMLLFGFGLIGLAGAIRRKQ